jgi:hypothetical protein
VDPTTVQVSAAVGVPALSVHPVFANIPAAVSALAYAGLHILTFLLILASLLLLMSLLLLVSLLLLSTSFMLLPNQLWLVF